MIDPFTQLYDRIIKELQERSDKLFKIVSFNSIGTPLPDTPQTSDLPEWQLRPQGMRVTLGGSSCATQVAHSFGLSNVSGSMILGKFYPGEWALMKALYGMQYDGLDDLRFNERRFVEQVTVSGTTTGVVDPSSTPRKIVGWASNWTIDVSMSFSSEDLQ